MYASCKGHLPKPFAIDLPKPLAYRHLSKSVVYMTPAGATCTNPLVTGHLYVPLVTGHLYVPLVTGHLYVPLAYNIKPHYQFQYTGQLHNLSSLLITHINKNYFASTVSITPTFSTPTTSTTTNASCFSLYTHFKLTV